MRLWYQSFARSDSFGRYAQAARDIIDLSADPGTVIEYHGLERGGFADQYRFVEHADTRELLANAVAAQRQGFDAFLVGNIADPGLVEARELLTIPVLGLCESTLHIACMMGHRFGVVAPNPKFSGRIERNILLYGLERRLAAVTIMSVGTLTDLGEAFEPGAARDDVLAQFTAAARTCAEQGAEVIVAGGGVLMALLTAAGIRDVDGVPVLDGVTALVKTAELAVRLREITGTFTSKAGTYAPPTGRTLDRVRHEYGDDVLW